VGQTWLRIFRPAGTTKPLLVVYIHGDGAVLGNARTRRLASKLATDLQAALVVVDYSLSPKARYPIAIEENYAAAWVAEHGNEHGLDPNRIALAADSTGADMADELMLMADERDGPHPGRARAALLPDDSGPARSPRRLRTARAS
jgi:acetyl esterase